MQEVPVPIVFAVLTAVLVMLARKPLLGLLQFVIFSFTLIFGLFLVLLAWGRFLLTWWYVPEDPNSRSLETSMFLESHLLFGRTLYEHNLSWRRDLSKYRAAIRDGEKPLARFRFSWRNYLLALLD